MGLVGVVGWLVVVGMGEWVRHLTSRCDRMDRSKESVSMECIPAVSSAIVIFLD